MSLVKLSSLSEKERKKLLEEQEERYQKNQQESKEIQKQANDNFVKRFGKGDTNPSHTTTYKNILDSMDSKEAKKDFKQRNGLTLWDQVKALAGDIGRIGNNGGLGADSGIKNLGNYMYTSAENHRQRVMGTKGADDRRKILESKELTQQEKNMYLIMNDPRYQKYKNADNSENNSISKLDVDVNKYNEILNRNPIYESIQGNEEKIAKNISEQGNIVTKKLAELAPSVGNMAVGGVASTINPVLGGTYFTLSAAGSYMNEAKARGMSEDDAITYGAIMGALEGITEEIGVGNIKKGGKIVKGLASGMGKEALKTATTETTRTGIKEALKNFGIGITDNFMQESIMEPLQEATAQVIGGKDKANWDNMGKRMLQSGIDGALTSIIMSGAEAGAGSCTGLVEKIQSGKIITQEEVQQAVKDAEKNGVDIQKATEDSLLYERDKIINQNADNKVINQEIKTSQNGFSQTEKTEALRQEARNKLESIKQNYDENSYNQMQEFIETAPSEKALNQVINDLNKETETKQIAPLKQKQEIQLPMQQQTENKSFEDIAFEAMEDYEDTTPQSPIQDRSIDTIGKETNKNAYQYDNPKVKPYFQDMAKMIQEDLGYVASSENRSTKKGGGTQLSTSTKAIDVLHNEQGYSYSQIAQGLQNIIDDNGKENNAVSKKLELIIDEQLREGYRNALGKNIAPNQEYINNIINQTETSQEQENTQANDINTKIGNYLNKTGLSSKMSVDEFINKAERFTLENEENMTEQQKELYDIIKDIQNRNSVKEETVDYDNGLWYNDKGIEFSNKFYEEQLDSAITTDTPSLEKNKIHAKEFGDNFYLFEKTDDGKYAKYLQLKIEGNEDIINFIEEAIKNGELTNIQKIHESIDEYWNRDTNSNGINSSNEEQTRENGQSSRFYREESKPNSRPNSEASNENSNVKNSLKNSKKSSFSLQDIEDKYKEQTDYLNLNEKNNIISIDNMVVKKELRNKGIGQSILNDIIDYANRTNKTITLTPTSEFNTKNKLKKWYKENGFVENNGKNTDFLISDTMYKKPSTNKMDTVNEKSTSYNQDNIVKDNKGRVLTKEQQKFFKNVSKEVLDNNGNLKTLYTGSNSEFTIFDRNKGGQSNKSARVGFWFTETAKGAENFANSIWYGDNKPTVYEVYLNLKNPKIYENINNEELKEQYRKKSEDLENKAKEIRKEYSWEKTDYKTTMTFDTLIRDYQTANYQKKDVDINLFEGLAKERGFNDEQIANMEKDAKKYIEILGESKQATNEYNKIRYGDAYEQFRTDIYEMAGKTAEDANIGGLGMMLDNEREVVESYRQKLIDEGYDGIIIKNTRFDAETMGGENTQYVAFYPEQIKSVENTNPTNNPDILKEEYQQLSIEGFNNEPENNLSKENWNKYQESKKKTNEVLKKEGTKIEVEKRKFSKDFIDNGYIDLNGKTIENASEVADMAQIFRNPKYETFRVLYLKGNTIVGQEAVSSKTPNMTNVYTGKSQAKGLYRIGNRMERLGADGYYLIHNHPTGVAKASNADIKTTSTLYNHVKGFLGHVIINSGTYALIEKASDTQFRVTNEIKIENYKPDQIDKMLSKELWANTQIKGQKDILNLAYDLKNNPNYSSLILADAKLKPRIVLDVPNSFLNMSSEQIDGYVRNVAKQNGASDAFIATQDTDIYNKMEKLAVLRDNILYSVDEDGNLHGKNSKTKDSKSGGIFDSYSLVTLRANEKIEDIYNSFFGEEETKEIKLPLKQKQEVTAPMKQQEQNNNTKGETINWTEIERPENNQKFRKHYRSIIESSNTTAEAKAIAKELMGTDTYTPESNKSQIQRADNFIEKYGIEKAVDRLMTNLETDNFTYDGVFKRVGVDDIALGERLIQYFSKTGDGVQLQNVLQATAVAGTEAGRAVQIMSILNHQTPQGQATWIQRSVDKMNTELAKRKGGTITTDENGNIKVINKQGVDITNKVDLFNLTPEMINKIIQSENQDQMWKNIDEVYEELGQQVPKSMLGKIDSWRYFSMLANARTHIRNMVGNFAMGKMQRAKDKLAGGIEDVVSKFNPEMERTKTLRRADKKTKEFAIQDFKNPDVQSMVELNENKYHPQSRLENARRTFKHDALENTLGRMFKANDNLLEWEDGIGLKAGYQKAMTDYLTANKIDVDNITDAQLNKARQYAVQQAKEATFHQANAIASAISQFENKNLATKLFTGAILPFKKTPMNVAKAGMEYSPLQIAKSATVDLVNLRKGNISVNQYIDNLSKGMTGTGIALVGYALANAGILKASGGDDKDKEKYEEEQGKQSYSIQIAGKTYSLDWLAPTGIPLFIGAETHKLFNQEETEKSTEKKSEEDRLNQAIKGASNLLNAGATAINPMSEMSMISGLTSALSSYNTSDNLGSLGNIMTNAGKSYVNQFFPTLMGQVAKTGDEYERTTKSTATGTIGKAVDQTINQIKNKIPGLRQTLPIKTDVWGKELKQEVNLPLRAFNNFINPATVKEVSTDKVDMELNKLYEENHNSSLLPDILTKTVQLNKQTYRLSNKEYAEFTKNYGQTSHKLIENFIKTSDYNKLTQEQKETAISNIYSYAKEQNKLDYAKKVNETVKPSTLYTTMKAIEKGGGKQSEYLSYLAKTKGMSKESEKNKVLADSNYSNKTKEIIYTNGTGKDDNLYNDLLSKSNINMTEYLDYKDKVSNKSFSADKDKNGKTITGSAKKKVINYLNNNITGFGNRLLIAGNSYALQNSEKQKLAEYINSTVSTREERLEIYKQLDKNFTIKDGKVYMRVSKR